MIKLIASDLDGTLLLENSTDVSEEAISLIDKLTKNGIVFVAASGRAYTNLQRLFEPVRNNIVYICENGSLVKYKNETLFKKSLDSALAKELVNDILAKDGCEVLISGEYTSYLMPKEESYVEHMKNHVKNDITIIEKFEDIKEDVIKVSVYKRTGVDDVSGCFDEKWHDKAQCTVSGVCWQDFVSKGVNKGMALQIIQEKFKIEPEFTMCFGDNYNDLAMFERAYFSYAMSGAKSEIRAKARYITMSVENILYDVDKMINFDL